jgi:DNA-binding NarL/FixJ family response regulator
MDKITVIIVDDHPIFRQGVIDTLSLESNIRVVAQASDGQEGLVLIRDRKPDVAVIDVNLPGMNGQQIARQVKLEKISTRIVLLTAYDDTQQQIHAIKTGAAAYCTKDIRPEELVGVIKIVAKGKYVFGGLTFNERNVERWLNDKLDGSALPFNGELDILHPLSVREMEVLSYVTRGLSNKEIAKLLAISHQTVKNHVTAILRKIGVEDRTQAAIYALRRGWVRLSTQNDKPLE